MASAKKQEQKELCEQELVTLDALQSVLRFATVRPVPVSIMFVRRFRRTPEAKRLGLVTCTARLTFGFRHADRSDTGSADAEVVLCRMLAADADRLGCTYWAWVVRSATVRVHKNGANLVYARSGKLESVLGRGTHPWTAYVCYAEKSGGSSS